MFEASWALFLISSLLLITSPGQDMILVMSRSITQGARAGVATAAGISVGLLGHTVLATLGLGAVLQASSVLFLIMKLLGAAYLIYLAIGLLRTRQSTLAIQESATRSLHRLFWDGALSNIANPKVAIFYFAFLPQFVQPGDMHPATTVFALGASFAALTFLVKMPVGLFAGLLSNWFRNNPQALMWMYRSSGVVLFALGLRLAFSRRE